MDAVPPQRVVLWTFNGITRVGLQRKLTKDEKRMLRPHAKQVAGKAKRSSTATVKTKQADPVEYC